MRTEQVRIDQYLPTLAPHDAIGNHTLQTRRVLREAGYKSDIWAEHVHPPLGREAKPYLDDSRTARRGACAPLPLLYQFPNGQVAPAARARRRGPDEPTTTTSLRRFTSPVGNPQSRAR